ncbi:MAG: penicillin-binding transpeptidase domain-containing protein [Cellulosilyticaceae bacterium]
MKKQLGLLILLCAMTGCSPGAYTTDMSQIETSENEIVETEDKQETMEVEECIIEVDYSEQFEGITGCAVFYNPKQKTYHMYKPRWCQEQVSPYSTFKIISSLMGLSNDVIAELGPQEVTLEEVFRQSHVWYYEKVMDLLEKSYVQQTLERLGYGNQDLSVWDDNGHHTFWIGTDFKISAKEQVEVLAQIFEGQSDFTQEDIQQVKGLMHIEQKEEYTLYGKTGSSRQKDAWFVGFIEKQEERIYFAIRIDDESQKLAGAVAKKIAREIIDSYQYKKE